MDEQWLPVVGWAGYEVSDLGRVRSVDRWIPRTYRGGYWARGRVLAETIGTNGYILVHLCAGPLHGSRTVHRLVLSAFIGPAPEGMEACHFDGIKSNNALSNLRWDSKSNNTLDRVRVGTHNKARKTACSQGHAYTPENTGRRRDGSRSCRTCERARSAAAYRIRRSA